MAFVKSQHIRVFPSIGRGNYDTEAELMNEKNITQLTNSWYNKKSFVVTKTFSPAEPLEFVIGGYYFKLLDEGLADLQLSAYNLWAGVKIRRNDDTADDLDNTKNYQCLILTNSDTNELQLLDDEDGNFEGVIFASTKEELGSDITDYLEILRNGTIPVTSRLHWNVEDLNVEAKYTSPTLTPSSLVGTVAEGTKVLTLSLNQSTLSGGSVELVNKE